MAVAGCGSRRSISRASEPMFNPQLAKRLRVAAISAMNRSDFPSAINAARQYRTAGGDDNFGYGIEAQALQSLANRSMGQAKRKYMVSALRAYLSALKGPGVLNHFFSYQAGRIFNQLGRNDLALKYMEIAVRTAPPNSRRLPAYRRDLALLRRDAESRSVPAMLKLAKNTRDKQKKTRVLLFIGQTLLKQKRIGEAKSYFRQAMKADPSNPWSKVWMGLAMIYSNDISEVARGNVILSSVSPEIQNHKTVKKIRQMGAIKYARMQGGSSRRR